ncbi:MAG: FtsX-like permease family protein, partial [Acidobacteriota bacterium]
LFAMIGVLVLDIACENYMNQATPRSLKRAKEIGLRKVVGAARGQIARQFLADSLMTTFLALLLAGGAVKAILPVFRSLVEREIAFDPVRDVELAAGLVILALLVGILAGSYPAFFLSAFRPATSLKGTSASTSRGRGLRNGLIVFQFATSIALIVCTIGVQRQLRYIRTADMGYEREQIVVLTPPGVLRKAVPAFKAELLRNPSVLAVSASSYLPNNVSSSTIANWPGKPDSFRVPIYRLEVDDDFVGLYGLKLARGRAFSRDFPSDSGGAFLINETAAKAIGWEDPLGRDFCRWGIDKKPAGRIVGVLRDFHMHSLHLPIMPLYVLFNPEASDRISIKIRGGDIPRTMAYLKSTWDQFMGGYPFEYVFFDDVFDRAYQAEQRLGTIFEAFAGLAVLVACLGLVGLASFTAEQKSKEIGIRKVLGASSSGVIILLSLEFMKWVVAANLIAWPIGYFAMQSWLRSFAYRTSLTVPMFLGAALAAFALAAVVISLQTYRAAAANPVESIRCE